MPISHLFTASIKVKYNLNNICHHYETEIDVNSVFICRLFSQCVTKGNSICNLHLKLWSIEHGLSWIISWFLSSKEILCLPSVACNIPIVPRWKHHHIFLSSSHHESISSLFTKPLALHNSYNTLELVMEFTLNMSSKQKFEVFWSFLFKFYVRILI